MNKKIKRIIALTLTISAFSIISAMTPGSSLDMITKSVYASSYTPSNGELKSLTVKSISGDTIDLRDGYNGSTVKLNDDKNYYTKLTDDSDGIKINANVKGEDYIVRIFTSDKGNATGIEPGEEILLGKGNTTLYVRTYESLAEYRKAKDSKGDVTICEEEYTINVKKTTESTDEDDTQDSIYLDNIELSKGDITFLKQRTSYDIEVASSVSEIKITAPPEDEDDRVRIDGSLVEADDNYKKTISLDDGENEIKIKVTDDKDNQRTYTLNVTRGSSSSNDQDDVYLNDLTISEGNLDFSDEDSSYDVDIDDSISKVTIGAKPEDEEYLVTIDGEEVNSGDDYEKKISLSKGKNTVKVVVEDEVNDKKRTYNLTINRGSAETNKDTDATDTSTDKKAGWIKTDAGWIYNNEDGTTVKSSWVLDKTTNKWYLLDGKGFRLSGWQYTDSKWYMLDITSGEMKTGWYKEENKTQNDKNNTNTTDTNTVKFENWYYLNNDGAMKTGWLSDGGKWYYLNLNGIMQKGWLTQSNSKYYLDTAGIMVTEAQTIDGKIYKFNSNGTLII